MNTTQLKSSANDTIDRMSDKAQSLVESKDQVVSDFKALLAEGESLFKNATAGGDHALAAARDKFKQQLDVAKARYFEVQDATVKQAKQAATATDEYVHGNPWTAVAVAGGVGLLVGLLVMNRREG
ncbi:MAG: DUF883 domain-containing protein [Burkholderiales bacterium]|nr:DUF883 domain-containing protein [Burkholderiales bacterium]